MLSKSFKAQKCKTSLKLAVARIKLLKNKRDVQVKQMKRDLAHLLETGQDQTARIRVEHVIREEKTMSAYDLIELYCELIVARLPIIESQKNCPIDLKEVITSVVFASPRCADIPELLDVRKHFTAKYGKDFINSSLELRPECGVNRLVVEKLSARAPDIDTKIKILKAVAQEHNIEWDSHAFEEKLQKTHEDLISGPSNPASTGKMPMESSYVQFPPPPDHGHESAPKISTTSTSRPTMSRPEHEVSESGYEGEEFRHPLPRGEDHHSNLQSWNMEFKDATSAALAAAESAERASMAARAAVDLASRGNYARRTSGPHDGGRGGGLSEPMISETEDTVKRWRREPVAESQQSDGSMQDSLRKAPERANEGFGSVKSSSTMSVPSPCRGPPIDTDISNVTPQKPNSNSQVSSCYQHSVNQNWGREEIREDSSLSEYSAKEHLVQHGSPLYSKKSGDGNVSVEDLQRATSYAQGSFSEAEVRSQNWNDKKIEIADIGQGRIGKKSREFVSLNSNFSGDSFRDDTMPESHDRKHETYVFGPGKGVSQIGINPQSYPDVPSAVFDDSGSDDDDHLDITDFIKGPELDSSLPHQQTTSPHSSNRGTWEPQQHGSTFLKNEDTTLPVKSHPAEFTESVVRNALPSQSAEISLVTYDYSDVDTSESEEKKDNFRHTQAESNVPDGSTGRHSVYREKLPSESFEITPKKEAENMDEYELPPPSRTEDSQVPFNLNYEGNQDLNLGRLTGGLRNKGFPPPPYLRSPVDGTSKQIENHSPPATEKLPDTQAAKASASFEVPHPGALNQTSHVKSYEGSKSKNPESYLDTDSSERKSRHGHRGGRYKLQEEQLVAAVPSNCERQTVIPSCETSEGDKLHTQEPFEQILHKNVSKESSSDPYLDLSGDKHALNVTERRGRGKIAAPLSSEKITDVSSHKASSRFEISTLDLDKQKARAKAIRKSEVRAKISYFDSDSDEGENLQPQRSGGGRDNIASKQSQRRVLPAESKVDGLSWSTRQSNESVARLPDLEKKEGPKFLQSKLLDEHPSTPPSQTEELAHKGRVNPSSKNQPNNGKPKPTASGGITSQESSLQSAAHVHPKLPDYETLAAHFHSLRSNRGGPY